MQLPLEGIFLETDNADYSIEQVYTQAARLRDLSMTTLEKQMETNFTTCFNIIK